MAFFYPYVSTDIVIVMLKLKKTADYKLIQNLRTTSIELYVTWFIDTMYEKIWP